MVDCEHCGESFDGEESYLEHLAATHPEEMGPIERRRLEGQEENEGGFTRPAVALVGALIAVAVGAYFLLFTGGTVDGIEAEPLSDRGDPAALSDVQRFDDLDRGHVATPEYDRLPPVGGPHTGGLVDTGFHEQPKPLGPLVHNLEHGHVVVYYEPGALGAAANESLERFARAHSDPWAAVVVVPTPVEDSEGPVVLTAWGAKLVLQEYDADTVQEFLAEYIGRGPENPVR